MRIMQEEEEEEEEEEEAPGGQEYMREGVKEGAVDGFENRDSVTVLGWS